MNGWGHTVLCLAVCGACAGGGSRGTERAKIELPVHSERIDIAKLEARRLDGVAGLWQVARNGSADERVLAVRGLARIGNDEAVKRLEQLIEITSRRVWIEAVRGLAITGAEGKSDLAALALSRASTPSEKVAALFSLGRLGTASEAAAIASALGDESTAVREAAGIALGMFGRRKIALSATVRSAAIARAADLDARVRYGAAYALAREHEPGPGEKTVAALVDLAADQDAEIRAVAVFGLARRKAPESVVYLRALDDADWRVAVQAVRALTQPWATERDRKGLAAWVARTWTGSNTRSRRGSKRPSGPRLHVYAEALAHGHLLEKADPSAIASVYDDGGDAEVRCRAAAARGTGADLATCARDQPGPWPEHEHARLQLELASKRAGKAAANLIADSLAHADPRIRAAAVTAHAPEGKPWDSDVLIRALKDSEPPVVGAAVEIMSARVAAGQEFAADVWAAATARAEAETDPELRLSLLDLLAKGKVPVAAELCRAAMTDSNRTIRQSARACVKTATGKDPGAGTPTSAPKLPPVNIADVVGQRVIWTVTTSRGAIVIELFPDVAPWHVAVLVSLTQNKFYDGLLWHRVVPDFVIQGGDPAGTGWGGPGFVVPAEPSALPYERGTVGIADAGLDTGGSQWFVMHSRAPHLDGRYTVVGKVTSGQDIVDSIRAGDTIVTATMRLSPAGQ